jgi:hypothetical protein
MQHTTDRSLHDSTRISVATGPTSAGMPGEMVILDPRSGRYFGLDGVGTRVWELLESPRSVGELQGVLVDEYDVDAARCGRDLRTLLTELASAGLIVVEDAEAP